MRTPSSTSVFQPGREGDVRRQKKAVGDGTKRVVEFIRSLIGNGTLRPGSRLPAERELAVQIGISRPTVRAGLRSLSAMGVVNTRHGSGTYISETPMLDSEPLSFFAALHGFTRDEMFEARRVLEVAAAGLAAERANAEQLAAMAEEVANLFATMDDGQAFLVHDIRFHRTVAAACGNPIMAALVEMVSALFYEQRRTTADQATDRNMRDAAELHRRIYRAIRSRERDRARQLMNDHLMSASAHMAEEEHRDRARSKPHA
jgi:GntR family transcriptional repressor for pyruvate dehydrogenase complex